MKRKFNTKEIYDILNSDQPNQNERQLAILYLIDKIEKGKQLNSVESQNLIIHFKLLNDLELLDFLNIKLSQNSIKEHEFRMLFPIYWDNLLGEKKVDTPSGETPIQIKDIHVNFLHNIFSDWKGIIDEVKNNKDQILNLVKKETQIEIEKLKKDSYFINLNGNAKVHREKRIYLYSKFVYILTKDFIVLNQDGKINILFNGKELWLDYVGFCHILFRHYGGGIRLYKTDKSFHTNTIHHKNLGQELITILNKIGESKLYNPNNTKYIPIKYKGIKYGIWIEKSTKSIKYQGVLDFLRIKTFYPIEDNGDLNKLDQEYTEIKISEDLTCYRK